MWRDPELYDSIHWDRDDAEGYYGRDLAPAYVPEGLTAAPGNGGASAVADKSGEIVEDIAWLGFYHDYYGDGSPKLTEEVPAHRGFSLTASRTGLLNDCLYILPENEVKTSDICGTAVTFGYRPMPYGPYDPDTHEPSGYYDLYVAEFECDGIECQIVAEQMEAEEVVKVVASIICGKWWALTGNRGKNGPRLRGEYARQRGRSAAPLCSYMPGGSPELLGVQARVGQLGDGADHIRLILAVGHAMPDVAALQHAH